MPLKYQKHIEISQAELYKGIDDNFSIVGADKNVIRSKSGKGAITLNIGDRASKDYRRLTLVASRLNRAFGVGRDAYLAYTNDISLDISKAKPYQRYLKGVYQCFFTTNLQDGLNTSKHLSNGNWQKFRVSFEGLTGLSMELEGAYLSRYPIISNSFIVPFIVISLLVIVVLTLLFYKDVYRYVKTCDKLLFAAIVATQLLVIGYYASQKKDFTWDEVMTYYHANNNEDDVFDYSSSSDWRPHRYIFEAMTAQPNEGLAHFNDLRTRYSPHSPLYFMQLHLVSLLFHDKFSIWLGAGLNMCWYIALSILIYALSKRFLAGKLALLPTILWGFSGTAISMVMYIRSYVVVTFFFTLLVYIALALLEKPHLTKRFYALLALVLFVGFDASNYFAVWLIGTAIVPLAILLYQRQLGYVIKLGLAFAVGGLTYYNFNPRILKAFNYRQVNDVSALFKCFATFMHDLNTDLFGGIVFPAVLLMAVMLIVIIVRSYFDISISISALTMKVNVKTIKHSSNDNGQTINVNIAFATIAVGIAFYISYISWQTNLQGPQSRYLWGLSPAFAILIVATLNSIFTRLKFCAPVFVVVVLLFAIAGYKNKVLLYFSKLDVLAISEPYRDMPVIILSSAPHGANPEVHRAINFRQAIHIPDDYEFLLPAIRDISSDDSVLVLISGDRLDNNAVFKFMEKQGFNERVQLMFAHYWLFSKTK
ncbi:hypothetical protein AGMMS49941_09310 [Deferribacterales bacterium]|nr:hypothetical protein AGMMS49941_09310 [Deferribacterales bacterium]